MASIKPSGKKRRLIKAGLQNRPVPFFAHIKKFGPKRVKTRRIRNPKQRHWRSSAKLKL